MEKLLVLVLFTAALFENTSALDRLVVNADNVINKLYIDGVDRTTELVNRKNWKQCDKIDIPFNSKVVAIQATNLKSFYGIQACETARNVLFDGWRCRAIKNAQSGSWYKPNYPAKYWKLSKGYRCKKHCRKYFKQPCPLYNQKCYWSNKYARTVRCRVKLCADNCKGCKKAGPGKCDPDKCLYGPANSDGTCPRECGIEVKTQSPLAGDKPDGYVKIWDTTSKTPEILKMTLPGFYIVAFNISTCSIYKSLYFPNTLNPGGVDKYLEIILSTPGNWGEPNSVFTNLVGITALVGDGVVESAPSVTRYTSLGVDPLTGSSNYAGFNPCLYRATFTGAPNELATLGGDEVVVDFDDIHPCNP